MIYYDMTTLFWDGYICTYITFIFVVVDPKGSAADRWGLISILYSNFSTPQTKFGQNSLVQWKGTDWTGGLIYCRVEYLWGNGVARHLKHGHLVQHPQRLVMNTHKPRGGAL